MFLRSCFCSFVPLYEGTCRKMTVSVPGKGGCCCPGLAGRLFNEGVYVEVVQVTRGLEICVSWSFWADRPSKDILVGTAPLDCVEITFCCSCTRRERICFVPLFFLTPPLLFSVPEGSCSSLSLLAPQGEGSLFEKLVSRARSSQVAHALGTRLGLICLYTLAFCLFI